MIDPPRELLHTKDLFTREGNYLVLLLIQLPILWKQIIQLQNVTMDTCAITYNMAGFLQPASYLSKVYKEINSYKYAVVHKLHKWESVLGKDILLNVFLKYIANLYKVTNIIKYRNFQYRFLIF